jgi:hypothetical protein
VSEINFQLGGLRVSGDGLKGVADEIRPLLTR